VPQRRRTSTNSTPSARSGSTAEVLDVVANSEFGLGRRFRPISTGKRVQKVNDLLLSGGRRVEFAAHLREPSVDMIAEVDKVFSKRVEAGCCRLSEIAEVTSDRADVPIGGTGQHSCGSRVALACLHARRQVAYLMLESGYPRFEIPRLHALTLPAPVSGESRSFRPRAPALKLPSGYCCAGGHDRGCNLARSAPSSHRS
jgi:hypothetical protein